jgi:hypothetical protein
MQKAVLLTPTPQEVAKGPGDAMFQGQYGLVQYWVSPSSPALAPDPTSVPPFVSEINVREPMTLEAGESLWIAGVGMAVVYAEVDAP